MSTKRRRLAQLAWRAVVAGARQQLTFFDERVAEVRVPAPRFLLAREPADP